MSGSFSPKKRQGLSHKQETLNALCQQLNSSDRALVANSLIAIVKETDGHADIKDAVRLLMQAFALPDQLEWNRNQIATSIQAKFICPLAIELMVSCLDSCNGALRDSATRFLSSSISETECKEPIRLIALRLSNELMATRKVAAQLLCQLADRHLLFRTNALTAVAGYLEHSSDYVREAAVQGLVALADDACSEQLIVEVSARLQHPERSVRDAACKTMLSLTESSEDLRAWITATSRCLDSKDPAVRETGVTALQNLGPHHSSFPRKILSPRPSGDRALALAPAQHAPLQPGSGGDALDRHLTATRREGGDGGEGESARQLRANSRATIACVGDRLESGDARVREEAIGALRELVRSGGHQREEVLSAAAWRLRHEEPQVRQAAVDALAVLALEDGGRESVAVLMQYLDEGSSETRTTALSALGKIANKGDAAVLQALSRQLQDADYRVVRQALLVIEKLARFE